LKTLLHKYTAFLLKWIVPLGPLGVFLAAILDSGAYGLPLDVVVAGFVFSHPKWFWLYTLMAAAGSAVGSLIIYAIGYKGEEVLLEKRISAERLEALRRRFERQEFLAMMIPSILPPPTPFKLFVLAAGAFRMKVRDFLLAIFTGRVIRFLILSALVGYFGPEIVHGVGELFRQHLWWAIGILVAALVIGVALWRKPWRALQKSPR
jgi:membrane protein YqaA with SNARE-associated domain